MEQAGVQLIAQGANGFDADMKAATKAVNSFVDSTEKGGGKVSAAGQVMIGGLREIGSLATRAFAEAAKATAAFIGDSIGLAGDFEAGMLNFQAVAGKEVDASGLEDFRDLFIDIGKRLPVSTMEVQQAAAEMVKGGIDPATIAAGGLERNIQFAAAAMDGDLVKAAEISAKVLGAWTNANATAAEKTDFLTNATDLLTKAANASATDVEGLSRGIFNAQGIAKTAGVGFEDLTTTLALLAPRFASSSEAGNSLKNMIARLQPTTDPATQAMESLGLWTEEAGSAFYDAQGNFVGFEQASGLLQESLRGLTKEQQASLLQTIFGNDAMGSAAALADGGAEAYRVMAEQMGIANGVMDTAALKQQGFNTSLDNAKGSVEAFQITVGSHLLPVLGDLLDNVIAPGINLLTDLASAVFGDEKAFEKLSPTMKEVATGIQQLGDDIQKGADYLIDLGKTIGDLIAWFGKAGAESSDLGSAVNDLSGIWEKAMVVVGSVMDAYMNIAQAVLPIITRFVDEHGEEIQAFFKTTWDSVIQIINLALDLYSSIVPPVLNAIAGFISDHGSEITKILSGVWEVITSLITGTLDTIKGVFKVALAVINGDWEGAWNGIKDIVNAQATAIGGVIEGFLNIIAGLFDTTLADIAQTWTDNWNQLVDIATSIDWAGVGASVVDGILSGLRNNWDSLMGWVSDKVAGLVDAAMAAIGASSPAKKFMPVGVFAVEGIMKGFSDTWPGLTSLVGTLSEDLIGQMQDIGEQINGVIADSFGATASIDRQIAKNLDSFKDILPQYEQFTTGALKDAQKQAEAFLDPAEGAKFFQMRSKQILEYAKLQKELAEAETAEDRQRLEAQMLLINRAQTAEIAQFNANAQAQDPMAAIANQVNEIMRALADPKLELTDAELHIVDMLSAVWDQLQTPINTRAQQYANPPQAQYPSGGQTTYSQQSTYNMPIYTNNSPGALQQSWAVMQASMP